MARKDLVKQISDKINDYYKRPDVKSISLPIGSRLVLLNGEQVSVPDFKDNAPYVDLANKHEGTICVARYNNKTKRTRVMCRIYEGNGEIRSFKECNSKAPSQITFCRTEEEIVNTVKKNLENRTPSFIKFNEEGYLYVTGNITQYDGEISRKLALSIVALIEEIAGVNGNSVIEEPKETQPEPPEEWTKQDITDEFELPDMNLKAVDEMKSLFSGR